MGNRFTAEDVALVTDMTVERLFEHLKQVLSLGLLLENKADLQFVHDRVQEVILQQVHTQERIAIHWSIGNRFLNALPEGANLVDQDNLFTIATHLNRGYACVINNETYRFLTPEWHGFNDDKSKEAMCYQLVEINSHAGNKALDALASHAANDFFRHAHHYLPDDCWETAYQLTYRIYQRLAKTDLMCGRYEESEALLNQLIDHAASDFDKAEALAEQTTSLSSFGNFNQAIITANRGLAYFAKAIPEDAEQAQQRMQILMADIAAQNYDGGTRMFRCAARLFINQGTGWTGVCGRKSHRQTTDIANATGQYD